MEVHPVNLIPEPELSGGPQPDRRFRLLERMRANVIDLEENLDTFA
jgi:hypothetical protein